MRRLLALAAFLLAALPASAQVYQIGDSLPCAAAYTSSNVGQTGLSITVDVYRNGTEVVTAAAATDAGDGIYTYTVAGAVNTAAGKYVCVFHNSTTQDIYLAYDVTPANANLDAAISTRSDFDELTDPVELLDSGGSAGTSAAELVADMAIPTAAANADAVWEEAIADHSATGGSTAEALDGAGGATAAQVWTYATRSLTTTGQVIVTAPVAITSEVSIVRGDSYLDSDGRALTWTGSFSPDPTTAASITLTANDRRGNTFSVSVTAVDASTLRAELVPTDTSSLPARAYDYDIEATFADGRRVTYVRVERGLTLLTDYTQ